MHRLEELINEYINLGVGTQLDYDKFYLYSIITHSTAIEGSTITEIENRLLFDEDISAHKPVHEQLMNLDLKAAYEKGFIYAKSHEPVTTELLCELSALVMRNTGAEYKNISGNFSSSKGQLRRLNVSAGRGGKSYMSWQKVPQKLQDFCELLNKKRKGLDPSDLQAVYKMSFEAHYNLVMIHPWADGNGRMSRLLMNMLQHEYGVVLSIVEKENKAGYIKALEDAADKEDKAIFTEYMLNRHMENIERQIREYKDSLL